MTKYKVYCLQAPDGSLMASYCNIGIAAAKENAVAGLGDEWKTLNYWGYKIVKCVLTKERRKAQK